MSCVLRMNNSQIMRVKGFQAWWYMARTLAQRRKSLVNGVYRRIRSMAGGTSERQRIVGDESRQASRDEMIS